MGINRVTKRGKNRIEVRKRWPDGSTFRRYYPNMTLAKHVLARIEESIATGRWKELKEELSGVKNPSGGYCQKLCMEPSGGDLILPDSVDKFHVFNDLSQPAVAL